MFFDRLWLALLQIVRTLNPTYVDICYDEGEVSFIGMSSSGKQFQEFCHELQIYAPDNNPSSSQLEIFGPSARSFKKGWNHLGNFSVSSMKITWNRDMQDMPKNLIDELPIGLHELDLHGNKIKKLPNGILNGTRIKSLFLHGNLMEEIEKEAFKDTIIEKLSLSFNRLSSIEFLKNLYSTIKDINLQENQIHSIPHGIFSNHSKLISLNLALNEISILEDDAFHGLQSLEGLDLSGNKLSSLPERLFSNLENLRFLGLARNQISSLETYTFQGLQALKLLDLGYNNLSATLPSKIFDGFRKDTLIVLEGNPISPWKEKQPWR